MEKEISKMTDIFSQINQKKINTKVEARQKAPDAHHLSCSNYMRLKADEYLQIVNGSFGKCLHDLSPFSYVLQKRAGNEPKKWKCDYLKRYIDRNIDFT